MVEQKVFFHQMMIAIGNCGDGLDNDNGGKADRDDPDCYANPTSLDGYDPNRTEANRDNDL